MQYFAEPPTVAQKAEVSSKMEELTRLVDTAYAAKNGWDTTNSQSVHQGYKELRDTLERLGGDVSRFPAPTCQGVPNKKFVDSITSWVVHTERKIQVHKDALARKGWQLDGQSFTNIEYKSLLATLDKLGIKEGHEPPFPSATYGTMPSAETIENIGGWIRYAKEKIAEAQSRASTPTEIPTPKPAASQGLDREALRRKREAETAAAADASSTVRLKGMRAANVAKEARAERVQVGVEAAEAATGKVKMNRTTAGTKLVQAINKIKAAFPNSRGSASRAKLHEILDEVLSKLKSTDGGRGVTRRDVIQAYRKCHADKVPVDILNAEDYGALQHLTKLLGIAKDVFS